METKLNMKEVDLDNLILSLFFKLINSEIYSISRNQIIYQINNHEVILEVYNRFKKEPEHSKITKLDELSHNFFPTYFEWNIDNTIDESLHDFYIIVKGMYYFVPRPPLKTYAEYVEILEEHIKNFELNTLNELINGENIAKI